MIAVCSRSFSRNLELREAILQRYDRVKFNDQGLVLEGQCLVEFLSGCERAIVGLERINGNILKNLPQLQVISKYGVGLDTIDLESLSTHNIRLGWKGGVNRRSVSELTIAFMIMMLRHLPLANSAVRNGKWRQFIGGSLTGKTVGIIGCGHVGKDLVHLLGPYECNILVYDIVEYTDFYASHNIRAVDLDTLLGDSDIVTLHIPLHDSTREILDAKKLNMMKAGCILINTARGELVDERTLKTLLQKDVIAGAAFDVFSNEPPDDLELLGLPNFFATPHLGGSSREAIIAMGFSAIEGLEINSVQQN